MGSALKDNFGPDIPARIAAALGAADARIDTAAFISECTTGWDDLELTPRAHRVADVMAEHLPADRRRAIDIVIASLGPELPNMDPADAPPIDPDNPMAGFFYLPHSYFVARHCIDEFDASMRANYEITKRFTAEFSVRAQLAARPVEAVEVLHRWADDPNAHVRRLVSEGSRPRLPWATRLAVFQADPEPVLGLLERLRDDPIEYVRRSVANNLNDMPKTTPTVSSRSPADGGPTATTTVADWCATGYAPSSKLPIPAHSTCSATGRHRQPRSWAQRSNRPRR